MSNNQTMFNLVITPELYEEYQTKCKRVDKRVTLKCLLLQLGYPPSRVAVWVNGEITSGRENILIAEHDELRVVPVIAGG
ncbi:MAG: sulfur carrier protein ThiS [Candidatus Hodarchaeales archaeon]|jgi:sulfur carrier protein ThiS